MTRKPAMGAFQLPDNEYLTIFGLWLLAMTCEIVITATVCSLVIQAVLIVLRGLSDNAHWVPSWPFWATSVGGWLALTFWRAERLIHRKVTRS